MRVFLNIVIREIHIQWNACHIESKSGSVVTKTCINIIGMI